MKKDILKKTASIADKQSVRTTFKLSDKGINALNEILETNNLKPKEFFDFICFDEIIDSVLAYKSMPKKDIYENLSEQQLRKTFVISKGALRMFNEKSKELELSRNFMVERIILTYKVLFENIAENEKKKDEESLLIMSDFMEKVYEVEDKLRSLHTEDSSILKRFSFGVVVMECLKSAIKSKVENGVPIAPDDINQS